MIVFVLTVTLSDMIGYDTVYLVTCAKQLTGGPA